MKKVRKRRGNYVEPKDKKVKQVAIYFSEREYEYFKKKAEKNDVKVGLLLKMIFLEAVKTFDVFDDDENPFLYKNKVRYARKNDPEL